MEIEKGEIVLCTVDKIIGTNVFVNINLPGEKKEGTIVMSEIAPGRIRNIRDYVVPKKKIVCKILGISESGNIHLSLRRVTQKEKKEVMEKFKQEKSYESILRTILKEKASDIINKIREKETLYDFLQNVKEDSNELEEILGKSDSKKILEILNQQKQKTFILKKEFFLKTTNPEGLNLIKEILGKIKETEIKYIAAGRYSIKAEAKEIKTADNLLKKILKEIEEKSKENKIDFIIKEK